jgi:hypothetical protein
MNQLLPHISNLQSTQGTHSTNGWGKGDEYHQSLSLSFAVLQKTGCCACNLMKLIDQYLPHLSSSLFTPIHNTSIFFFFSSAIRKRFPLVQMGIIRCARCFPAGCLTYTSRDLRFNCRFLFLVNKIKK